LQRIRTDYLFDERQDVEHVQKQTQELQLLKFLPPQFVEMFRLSFITTFVVQWLLVGAQNENIITKDTYFYGQSPLVPPPPGTGAGNWSAAYAKAKAFVAQLSLDEKINFTAGVTAGNGCSG